MKAEVTEEKTNKFLKRKELVVEIENPEEATPSKAAVQHLLAKQLGAHVEHVEIVNVMPKGGMSKSVASVFVWHDKKVKDLAKKEQPEEGKAEAKEEKTQGEKKQTE